MRSKRWILYTLAVVIGLAAGGTAVFLVGSAQRRDDRSSLQRYEAEVLASLRESGRVVQLEMKPTLAEVGTAAVEPGRVAERAIGWRRAFASAREEILALDPPPFLGDIEAMWTAVLDAYGRTADAIVAAANAAARDQARLLAEAEDAGRSADAAYDRAAAVIDRHKERLGIA